MSENTFLLKRLVDIIAYGYGAPQVTLTKKFRNQIFRKLH